MDYAAMGARIRRCRMEMGLTQEQLAEKVELSASFLGHIERGTRTASIDTLVRLCQALEVTADSLLGMKYLRQADQMPPRMQVIPCELLQDMAELLKKHEIPC